MFATRVIFFFLRSSTFAGFAFGWQCDGRSISNSGIGSTPHSLLLLSPPHATFSLFSPSLFFFPFYTSCKSWDTHTQRVTRRHEENNLQVACCHLQWLEEVNLAIVSITLHWTLERVDKSFHLPPLLCRRFILRVLAIDYFFSSLPRSFFRLPPCHSNYCTEFHMGDQKRE